MPFKIKNNAQTLLKQFQNNFEKGQKTTFPTPNIAKNYPSKQPKMSQFLTKYFNFRGAISDNSNCDCYHSATCTQTVLDWMRLLKTKSILH